MHTHTHRGGGEGQQCVIAENSLDCKSGDRGFKSSLPVFLCDLGHDFSYLWASVSSSKKWGTGLNDLYEPFQFRTWNSAPWATWEVCDKIRFVEWELRQVQEPQQPLSWRREKVPFPKFLLVLKWAGRFGALWTLPSSSFISLVCQSFFQLLFLLTSSSAYID